MKKRKRKHGRKRTVKAYTSRVRRAKPSVKHIRNQIKRIAPRHSKKSIRRISRKTTKQAEKKRIKKAIKRARHLSTVIRQKKLARHLRKIADESFNALEARAAPSWRRAARRNGITYDAFKAKARRRHKPFTFVGIESRREYETQAVLIKRGRNKGKYKVFDEKLGRTKTITAANFARSKKMRAYWSQVRWIARAARLSVIEARAYYDEANDDSDFSYAEADSIRRR